jgi:aminoglycoside 2'-N-acetyltransferase I
MSMRIAIEPGPAAWHLVRPLLEAVWPDPTPAPWGQVAWAQGAGRRILMRDDGSELICHVGLHLRDVTWDGRAVRVGGVGGVVTRADRRRNGLATAAMKRAAQEIGEVDKADFALLFCQPPNFAFYQGLGWRQFEGEVFVEQPHGRVRFDVMPAFVLDLRLQPRSGVIDLCGPPW